jgi:hypothetical protein
MQETLIATAGLLALTFGLAACGSDSGGDSADWEPTASDTDIGTQDTVARPDDMEDFDTSETFDTEERSETDVGSCAAPERPEAVAVARGSGEESSSSITVPALAPLELDASESSAPEGADASYRWSVLESPDGSETSVTDTTAETTRLLPDRTGTYRVRLEVSREDLSNCSATAVVEITAEPTDKIRVQLTWSTPGDSDETDSNGTDLNLHYLKADESNANWGESPWDVFWQNKSSSWGDEGPPDDDPALDIDDIDGAGPENVIHPNSPPGRYAVGVEYFDASGFGPSDAEVTIFVDGTIVQTYEREDLEEQEFWYVADIVPDEDRLAKVDEVTVGFPTE